MSAQAPEAAHRVKEIVEELSTLSLSELSTGSDARTKLDELEGCMGQVRGFADLIEGLLGQVPLGHRGPGRPRGRVGSNGTRRGGRRGRRGPGEFPATTFIEETVRVSGKDGILNSEIVDKIKIARPNGHVRPSALVSTILTRLKAKGAVTRRRKRWYAK